MTGKRRFGIIVIILILAAGLITGILSMINENSLRSREQAAWQLYDKGEYALAAEAFRQLDGYHNAAAGLDQCNEALRKISTEEKARSLLANGDANAALSLLRAEYAESPLVLEAAEAYAKSLVGTGKASDAVTFLETEYPDSKWLPICRQWVALEQFGSLVEAGRYDQARARLDEFIELNNTTGGWTEEEVAKFDDALQTSRLESETRKRAEEYLLSGQYDKAYMDFSALNDDVHRQEALDGMVAAEDFDKAMLCLASTGDYQTASLYLGRWLRSGGSLFNSGKPEYTCQQVLNLLQDQEAEDAAALRNELYIAAKAECETLMANANYGNAYTALDSLLKVYPEHETELRAQMKLCLQDPPAASQIISSTGDLKGDGVHVTIHNQSGSRSFVVNIVNRDTKAKIMVFVTRRSQITIALPVGYYTAMGATGDHWFGTAAQYGPDGSYSNIEIERLSDSKIQDTSLFTPTSPYEPTYMDGDYSMTIQ